MKSIAELAICAALFVGAVHAAHSVPPINDWRPAPGWSSGSASIDSVPALPVCLVIDTHRERLSSGRN